MIGQRFQGTLWRVNYTYKALAEGDQAEHFVQQVRFLLTADPAGGDLLEVAKLVALGGKPELAQDFVLQEVSRIGEASGLGIAVGADRGWPAGLDVGAELILKDLQIRALERQIAQLQGEAPQEPAS